MSSISWRRVRPFCCCTNHSIWSTKSSGCLTLTWIITSLRTRASCQGYVVLPGAPLMKASRSSRLDVAAGVFGIPPLTAMVEYLSVQALHLRCGFGVALGYFVDGETLRVRPA